MRRLLTLALTALSLCGGVQAQTNEQLKQMLDQALKTIDDLKGRVQALEAEQKAAPSRPRRRPPPHPARLQWGAPVVVGGHTRRGREDARRRQGALEIYGQVMLDGIYDFKRMNPDYSATLRPSQIPVNCPGDAGCGKDGNWVFSARQSSLGLRSFIPTSWGLVKTDLSFDLFGSDGSTSIHWLSIWAELGMFGVGQTYSNFMDIDVFPNTIDYWGPSGMVFVRNPQIRYHAVEPGRHEDRALAGGAELGAGHRQDQRDLARFRRRLHRLEPPARPDGRVAHGRRLGPCACRRHPASGGLPEHAHAGRQPVGPQDRLRPEPDRHAQGLRQGPVQRRHSSGARPSPAT